MPRHAIFSNTLSRFERDRCNYQQKCFRCPNFSSVRALGFTSLLNPTRLGYPSFALIYKDAGNAESVWNDFLSQACRCLSEPASKKYIPVHQALASLSLRDTRTILSPSTASMETGRHELPVKRTMAILSFSHASQLD